jgi:hypothetical protein
MAQRPDREIFWVVVIAAIFWLGIWQHQAVVNTAHKALVFLTTR